MTFQGLRSRSVILILGLCSIAAQSAPPRLSAKIVGKGPPMILIPGLACDGAVWDSAVEHFKDRYQCHVLTLAGFAGQPAARGPFLDPTAQAIIDYVNEQKLKRPVVVGHSLGGHLVFKLGTMAPELFGPLVAVDGMPCFMALFNENVTPEQLKSQGQAMRKQFESLSPEDYQSRRKQMIATWIKNPKLADTVARWGSDSDRTTVTTAIGELFAADVRGELSKLRSPVLLVVAHDKDLDAVSMTKDDISKRCQQQLKKAPRSSLAIADNARHFIMFDAPGWLFETMDQFLKENK